MMKNYDFHGSGTSDKVFGTVHKQFWCAGAHVNMVRSTLLPPGAPLGVPTVTRPNTPWQTPILHAYVKFSLMIGSPPDKTQIFEIRRGIQLDFDPGVVFRGGDFP